MPLPEFSVFGPWQHGCFYLLPGRLSGILLLGKAQEMMPALSMKLRWTWGPQHMMKTRWRWVWLNTWFLDHLGVCPFILLGQQPCVLVFLFSLLFWRIDTCNKCLRVLGHPNSTEGWYLEQKIRALNSFSAALLSSSLSGRRYCELVQEFSNQE